MNWKHLDTPHTIFKWTAAILIGWMSLIVEAQTLSSFSRESYKANDTLTFNTITCTRPYINAGAETGCKFILAPGTKATVIHAEDYNRESRAQKYLIRSPSGSTGWLRVSDFDLQARNVQKSQPETRSNVLSPDRTFFGFTLFGENSIFGTGGAKNNLLESKSRTVPSSFAVSDKTSYVWFSQPKSYPFFSDPTSTTALKILNVQTTGSNQVLTISPSGQRDQAVDIFLPSQYSANNSPFIFCVQSNCDDQREKMIRELKNFPINKEDCAACDTTNLQELSSSKNENVNRECVPLGNRNAPRPQFEKIKDTNERTLQFIEFMKPFALQAQELTGYPASVIMAQAAFESTWGTSVLARNHNSFFGHYCFPRHQPDPKAPKPTPSTGYIVSTPPPRTFQRACIPTPYKGGESACFLEFPTPYDSVLALAQNVAESNGTRGLYPKVRTAIQNRTPNQPANYEAVIDGLDHYATSPTYKKTLKTYIRKHKFDELDHLHGCLDGSSQTMPPSSPKSETEDSTRISK